MLLDGHLKPARIARARTGEPAGVSRRFDFVESDEAINGKMRRNYFIDRDECSLISARAVSMPQFDPPVRARIRNNT